MPSRARTLVLLLLGGALVFVVGMAIARPLFQLLFELLDSGYRHGAQDRWLDAVLTHAQ